MVPQRTVTSANFADLRGPVSSVAQTRDLRPLRTCLFSFGTTALAPILRQQRVPYVSAGIALRFYRQTVAQLSSRAEQVIKPDL